MRGIEKIGGWLLLAGGLVFLGELVIKPLKQFENIARLGVAAGAATWILGHVVR